ncbi:hypothetical protein POM88_024700 [Heracleum sosnowskyi]|uniref:F-box domain-containing protein n=1 Tax=Heracleum sosnowskyi TaxID=360622 RepID=A0AAD8MLP4_9APIA|nr:hypothetical protein POM88_024700 [Heracleum sosnowskyi]
MIRKNPIRDSGVHFKGANDTAQHLPVKGDGYLTGTSHLPQELLLEVLLRVPVKPLLRFRCVSKPWCSLIDNASFGLKHLEKSIECNPGSGIVREFPEGEKHYLVDVDSEDKFTAVEIGDSLKTDLSGTKYVASKAIHGPGLILFQMTFAYGGDFGVYANGSLYWLGEDNNIFAFDLGVHRHRELSYPAGVDDTGETGIGLVALNRCLCLIGDCLGLLGSYMELCPVAFSKTRDNILLFVDGDKLMWYDHGRKKVKNVTLNGFPQLPDLLVYTESLVPLSSKLCDGFKLDGNQNKMSDFISKGFKLMLYIERFNLCSKSAESNISFAVKRMLAHAAKKHQGRYMFELYQHWMLSFNVSVALVHVSIQCHFISGSNPKRK